jgi:hypothetical protein
MKAGGVTSLAENGVAPHIIQDNTRNQQIGIRGMAYIWKHPVLLQAMFHA